MHPVRRHLVCASMVILLVLSGTVMSGGGVSAKAALPYGYGTHSGHYGRHWVLDMYDQSTEYPAVTCRYDSALKLRSLSIRPPVVFAYDRTSHLDRQDVAWRAVVEYSTTPGVGPWIEAGRTPLRTASTTDERAAAFGAETFTFPKHPGAPIQFRRPGHLPDVVVLGEHRRHQRPSQRRGLLAPHPHTLRSPTSTTAGASRTRIPPGSSSRTDTARTMARSVRTGSSTALAPTPSTRP